MWVGIALLAIQFGGASISKLMGQATEMFTQYGYSNSFMYLIGVVELSCAIGLFIPKTRPWACYGLIAIMLGAAYTHAVNDELPRIMVNLVIIGISFGIMRLNRAIE